MSPSTTPKDQSVADVTSDSRAKIPTKSNAPESAAYSPSVHKRANLLLQKIILTSPPLREKGVTEKGNIITNYGNPSESYFIMRLLNRTQIKNSLQNVYEEIMKPPEVQEQPPDDFSSNNNNIVNDLEKSIIKEPYELPKPDVPSPVPETILEKPVEEPIVPDLPSTDTNQQETEEEEDEEETVQENEETDDNTEDSSKPEQESIQINEVSSSSPVDAPPKPGKRKLKSVSKVGYPISQFPPRALRSSDVPQTLSQRPQTRLNADKTRANASVTPNIQKKNYNPQVPSPTHTPKPIGTAGKVTTVQQKSKFASGPSTLPRSESKKISEKNVKSQKVPLVNAKQEKIDTKGKSLSVKMNDSNTNFSRITRSKDIQSPSDAINKETTQPKKFQSNRDNKLSLADNQSDRPKTMTRGHIGTRQKTSLNDTVPFCPVKIANSTPKGRNREQVAGSNPECCKENVLTPVCTTPGPVPLNSTKRRNSGGGTGDLEPKKKRRTRLGDKNHKQEKTVQEQHQDITSTESNFVIDMPICNDQNVVPEGYNQQFRNTDNTFNDLELSMQKSKNKKDNKFVKGSPSSNEITGEVHSTTIHIENDANSKVKGTISTLRTLRPRHDLSLSDKKLNLKSDKRVLRSNNSLTEIVCGSSKLQSYKERPILRAKNSVGAIPSKCTPRRRVPWQQTLRHNLRRKLVK